MASTKSGLPQGVSFVICVVGIYLSYLAFGILQEEINTTKFGEEKEKFTNTTFLVFVQCLANCVVAYLTVLFLRTPADKTPPTQYFLVSISYVSAMFASNFAIQYVNYPTMVLAKSCKPIPVLFMGVLVLGKSQSLFKYIVVFLITFGISIFMFAKISDNPTEGNSTFGIILLLTSLALDGITGPFQEKLIKNYQPSQYHMMFYSNFWACFLLGIVLVVTGQGIEGIQFCIKHPSVVPPLLLFSFASAVGQNFIYYTIFTFGSLTCSLITTTRKFFSILLSIVWFGHSLSPQQWIGVTVVFFGLGLDLYNSNSKKHND